MTAAPDTAPTDASKDATKYCAVTLSDDSLKKLINDNNGITAVDAGWATIHAITAKRVNVLAVPEKAIKKDGTKTYCSVLQGNEKYDLYVEVGTTAGGYVEILSGLNEGDVVVLSESTGNGSNNTDNKTIIKKITRTATITVSRGTATKSRPRICSFPTIRITEDKTAPGQ